MADIESIWSNLETGLELAVESFRDEAKKMRAGGVNMETLKNIPVSVYGSDVPLYQVATIGTPSAITAVITPWDKNNVKMVADALTAAFSGEATPSVKGTEIYMNFPALTQEKKEEFVKQLRDRAENFRQGLRDLRQEAKSKFEDMKKEGDLPEDNFYKAIEDLDSTTKEYTEKINEVYESKKEQLLK